MDIQKLEIEIYKQFPKYRNRQERVEEKRLDRKESINSKGIKSVSINISISHSSIERKERIENLKFLIEKGLYVVDSKLIAENLVRELLDD
jgi:anti-sigma28 factor (negative regulator of flagellin synthesis)